MKNINADRDNYPRKILETDLCDWCTSKKAIITDGTYVYCSKECENLFRKDAFSAIQEIQEEMVNNMIKNIRKNK